MKRVEAVANAIFRFLDWWFRGITITEIIMSQGMLLIGIMIVHRVQFAFWVDGLSQVKWNTLFADIPVWVGWYCIFYAVDQVFGRGRGHWLIAHFVLWPPLRLVLTAIFGPERVARLSQRATTEDKEESRV